MQKLLEEKIVIFALGIGLILIILGLMGLIGKISLPSKVSAATATVAVSATVQEWLSFSVSPTSTALTPDLVDSVGNTNIGSSTVVDLNLGSNSNDGWSIDIRGATPAATCTYGGLLSGTYSICQPSTTSTLSAGTDGYGANATSVLAGVTINANYNYWGTVTVGELNNTDSDLATKSTPNATVNVVDLKIYAASDSAQAAGTYTDTITLTAVAAP